MASGLVPMTVKTRTLSPIAEAVRDRRTRFWILLGHILGKFAFSPERASHIVKAMWEPFSPRLRSFASVCLAAGVTLATPSLVCADVVPHQATYTLRMAEVSGPSAFNDLSGAAVTLIEKTCDGWVIDEQIVMTMHTNAGGAINREMTFKATESLSGDSFRFISVSDTDGTIEEYKGSARVRADGSAEAEFITPRPFEMPLPKGVNFYVSTTEWLLKLAKSGAKTGQTVSFDGSDDDGPHKMTAFILPDRGARASLKGDQDLLSGKAWDVRLAFFKLSEQAGQPDFEIALRLLENGIITRFKLIFEEMTIDQFMDDVLPATEEKCG